MANRDIRFDPGTVRDETLLEDWVTDGDIEKALDAYFASDDAHDLHTAVSEAMAEIEHRAETLARRRRADAEHDTDAVHRWEVTINGRLQRTVPARNVADAQDKVLAFFLRSKNHRLVPADIESITARRIP